jgi:Eukaryotic aspartyl protease
MKALLHSILCLLAVSGVSYSIPLQQPGIKGPFVRSLSSELDGSSEYFRGMLKYNITPTHPHALSIEQRLSLGDEGLVPAVISNTGISFKSPITIGSQQFLLDFDTGSPDLWVYSTFLETLPYGNHSIYNPALSQTATAINATWNINYRDGSSGHGIVFEDTVGLGGITMEKQAVGAAVVANGMVMTLESDGVLGLSPASNSIVPAGIPTFLQNLGNDPQTKSQVFTCSLTRPNEPVGFFTFGYIDSALLGSNIPTYTPVDPENGYWQISSEFIIVNGSRIERPSNTAIIDTGTTGIFISDDILPAIYEPIGGYFDEVKQGWVFPADTLESELPTVGLPAGNVTVTLDSKYDLGFMKNGSWIFGSIQSRGSYPYDVLGDFWLRNIYAIWDYGVTGDGLRFGVVPRTSSS